MMDPRASGGVQITRDLLGMAARAGCGGGNACLAEHPTPKPVTDNLDNFSNRGDSHRLSTPSTHNMRLLSLFLLLRRSPAEVIEVTEVIGYRRSHPCKWRRLGNLAGLPLTPHFLFMVKLAISLDPSRSLYSSATTGPRSHPQYHPVASKMLKWSSSASSRSRSWFPTRKPSSAFKSTSACEVETSPLIHSYYDPSGCLGTIFPKAAFAPQKDHRH
jgi:hypothetical protein